MAEARIPDILYVYSNNPEEPCQSPDMDQQGKSVPNYVLHAEQQLMRFLIIGTEGGTYHAREAGLAENQASCIASLIAQGQGEFVVEKVKEVLNRHNHTAQSQSVCVVEDDGEALCRPRCARPNSALLALAMCCRSEDKKTRVAAYKAVCAACKIPTHLFLFVQYIESLGQAEDREKKTTGWGRGMRKAVSEWYNQWRDRPIELARLITKYRQRHHWNHRDILTLSHTKPANDAIGFILQYARNGLEDAFKHYPPDNMDEQMRKVATYLHACHAVRQLRDQQNTEEVNKVTEMIVEHNLVREHVAPGMLKSALVWQSLLPNMPLQALIRNLNKMTEVGVLNDERYIKLVVKKLTNKVALQQCRVHPYCFLLARMTYQSGHSCKGSLKWRPVPEVVAALEDAFVAAFENVAPTKKRILIALDVNPSMSWQSPKTIITPLYGSAAMMMATYKKEPACDVVAFSTTLTPLNFDKKQMNLQQVVDTLNAVPAGDTDCSQPMIWAMQQNKLYDAFIIYTDSETWFSRESPASVLRRYRIKTGIENAKLVTVAMTSDGFTLSDPADVNMLDMVGFDADAPAILHDFIAGTLHE